MAVAAWGRECLGIHAILGPTRLVRVHVVVDEHAEALLDVVAQQLLHVQRLRRRRRGYQQERKRNDEVSDLHGLPLTTTSESPAGCPVKLTRTKPVPVPKPVVAVRVCAVLVVVLWSTAVVH